MADKSPYTTISVSYSTRDKLKDILDKLNEEYEKKIKYDDVISYIIKFIERENIEPVDKES